MLSTLLMFSIFWLNIDTRIIHFLRGGTINRFKDFIRLRGKS